MVGSFTQLANWTVANALGVYYQSAAHRIAADALSFPRLEGETPLRPLHFFRGMMHFEPSPPYLSTLKAYGFQTRIFHFPDHGEKNLFRAWRENAADAIRHFIVSPESLGERPFFCGHSAGGFAVYALAALAKGGDVAAIREECRGLASVPLREMEQLREKLSGARFAAIATPFHGVSLTRLGQCLNRLVVDPIAPFLVSGIDERRLNAFYRRVRKHPAEVMDANLVSNDGTPIFHGGSVSKLSTLVIQGGMRAFTPFLNRKSGHDGIVPPETAILEGPRQVFAAFDHLKLVEMPEAATVLVDLLRQAEGGGSLS